MEQHQKTLLRRFAFALLTAQLGACVLPEVIAVPLAESEATVETSAPIVMDAPNATPANDTSVAMTQAGMPDSGAVQPMSGAPEPAAQPAPSQPAASGSSNSCQPSACQIDGECFHANAPRPSSLCEYCDSAKSRSAWTARIEGTSCDDGVFCNGIERCGAGQQSGRCLPGERPCPENGDTCKTCDEETQRCRYATSTWTWDDPNDQMEWALRATELTTLVNAEAECTDLLLCGRQDWHLATISELRELIRRCPATEPAGDCLVSDNCTTNDCSSTACEGCGSRDNPTGSYCADEVQVVVPLIASGTRGEAGNAWRINCSTGEIARGPETEFRQGRCVRRTF